MADKVAASQENNEGVTEDGIEDAFEVSMWMWMHIRPYQECILIFLLLVCFNIGIKSTYGY